MTVWQATRDINLNGSLAYALGATVSQGVVTQYRYDLLGLVQAVPPSVYMPVPAVDIATQSELDAAIATAPSLDELIATGLYFESTSLTGTGSFPIFIAPFSCRVLSAEFVIWDGTPITPSDTVYWEFDIRKYKAAALTAISGTISTKTTGGIIRANRTGYNWDASSWATVTVDKDDIVALACLATGGPAVLGPKIGVTVRYMPL